MQIIIIFNDDSWNKKTLECTVLPVNRGTKRPGYENRYKGRVPVFHLFPYKYCRKFSSLLLILTN